jgi:hypothetical protein
MRELTLGCVLLVAATGCETGEGSVPAGDGGAGAGGGTASCESDFESETLRFAVGTELAPGQDETMCLRWTTPEALDITGFVGELGAMGHHALLLVHETPTEPDGLAPCYEPELMDVATNGDFSMLAGVSYETSGLEYVFPTSPVQVGLGVPAGSQLILDAHFLNTGGETASECVSLELQRGERVIAQLEFRTVLPEAQYALRIPPMGSTDETYTQTVGERVRVAAASSHMHQGATHFRMSVAETDRTLFETTSWAEPRPAIFDTEKIVLEADQTFQLDCSFDNPTANEIRFPDQMCVGGLYLLPCTLPGAC